MLNVILDIVYVFGCA